MKCPDQCPTAPTARMISEEAKCFPRGSSATSMFVILALVFFISMTSCTNYLLGWASNHPELVCKFCRVSDSTTVKDSTYIIPTAPIKPDSTWQTYFLHCDSLNELIMDSLDTKNGTIVHLKTSLSKASLRVLAYIDSLKQLPQKVVLKTVTHDVVTENPVNAELEKTNATLTNNLATKELAIARRGTWIEVGFGLAGIFLVIIILIVLLKKLI